MHRVLLAGASGTLGRQVAAALRQRGHRVRGMSRNPSVLAASPVAEAVRGDLRDPCLLRQACRGVETVVSCAGGSMRLTRWRDRRSFTEVDLRGNRRLLQAALEAGVRRFVYVGVAGAEEFPGLEYAAAHHRFGRELAGSGLEWAVVKPTGLFSFFEPVLHLAQRGLGVVVGPGSARTNPIDEGDAAELVADAVRGLSGEIPCGGPDVLTRREIVEAAFRAVGRRPRILALPAAAASAAGAVAARANPRLAALYRFGVAVSQRDCIAPAGGRRRLEDRFRAWAPRSG